MQFGVALPWWVLVLLVLLLPRQVEISPRIVGGVAVLFAFLGILNRVRVTAMPPYLIGGVAMWFLMASSGVHATISGVLVAMTIPARAGLGSGARRPTNGRKPRTTRPVTAPLHRVRAPLRRFNAVREKEPPTG